MRYRGTHCTGKGVKVAIVDSGIDVADPRLEGVHIEGWSITLNSTNPTVQVALNNLGSGYVPDTSVIMAGTLVGTLPVIVVFLLLGR